MRPEALLLANTLVETETVIKDEGNKDTGQEGEGKNSRLDSPPKWFFPSVIDRWDCVADHYVAEEDNPDWDKSVESNDKGTQEGS